MATTPTEVKATEAVTEFNDRLLYIDREHLSGQQFQLLPTRHSSEEKKYYLTLQSTQNEII